MIYNNFDKIIIRSPLLSFNILEEIADTESLVRLLDHKLIQESIYLASPELYRELKKYLLDQCHNKKERQRILISSYKYISRMASRCTPFGLFAGCFIGDIAQKTDLKKSNDFSRKTRLDMFFLCELHQYLCKQSQIRTAVKYYPNTTIYRKANKYRYIEYKYNKGQRKHILSMTEHSEYLEYILKIASKGVCYDEMLQYLINESIEEESAISFINKLIDYQLIIDELSPTITGIDYLEKLISKLSALKTKNDLLFYLSKIKDLLKKSDTSNNNEKIYEEIILLLKKMNIDFNEKFIFQVDLLHKMEESTISKIVANELKSTIKFLNKINDVIHNNNIKDFREAFYRRYENRMVPLLEVLDSELGISYPINDKKWDSAPLIDDIIFPDHSDTKKEKASQCLYQDILLKKLTECLANNENEIILSDNDFVNKKTKSDDLPPTTAALFEIIKENNQELLIRLKSCGGFSGASLFARFAYLDPEIERFIKKITDKEQELLNDKVVAEIVHLPDSRTGNILSRPHFREYEIVYMTNSDLNDDCIIPASDLMLFCRGDELVLFSKKIKKEIIPRLTNAHNYNSSHCTPLYRFLCDMQMYSMSDLTFSWGTLRNQLFLPRVKYRNTILAPMTWNINKKDFDVFLTINEDSELNTMINEWRKNYHIPQYILFSNGDNSLLVDFKNTLSIHALLSEIKKKDNNLITLTEFLFDKQEAMITNEKGSYTNECLMAFYKKNGE